MNSRPCHLTALVALALFAGCASGPPVPKSPWVQVSLLRPVVTPNHVHFVAKVVIKNRMALPLEIERIDYRANVHDAPLFDRSFGELHPMRNWGRQTVTLPFDVPRGRIVDQAVDVLAEEQLRVGLDITVVPVGWDPIPLRVSRVVTVPRPPKIAYDGSDGDPLRDGTFTIYLRVENPNDFAVSFGAIDTWLRINDKKYTLVRADELQQLGPGERGRLALMMEKTRGKGLSMIINVLGSQQAQIAVGGSVRLDSPQASFQLPIELDANGLAAPSR